MKKHFSTYANLVKEQHPTKNGDLNPEHLIHGIDKKVGGDILKIKTTNGRKVCPKDPFLKKMLLFAFI